MKQLAIVTGGTRGIGLAIVKALIAKDMEVVAIYRGNADAATACRDETGAQTIKLDVRNYEECAKVVNNLDRPVSVLINNAGMTRDAMLHKMDPALWHEVIDVNLTSCFNMSHAVMKMMRDQAYGRIVNISSINGQKGQLGQTNYAAAKAGILGFTKALALEGASKNITVNAICPGYIETDMTADMNQDTLTTITNQIPCGHLGQPADVAAMTAFLASKDAGFVNGAVINVNGGQYMG